jgi:mannose-1-phosphate guanylyltransferase
MKRTAVIMAGGSGERFWPLSRQRKPKQLLSLISEKTMLEEAIERITDIIPLEDIFIITSKLLLEPIRETLPDLPKENVIAEPAKRNTAPCLALAAAFIAAKYENIFKPSEISISVLTADHLISPTSNFQQTITSTLDYVERNEKIAIIGIKPQRPETGTAILNYQNIRLRK